MAKKRTQTAITDPDAIELDASYIPPRRITSARQLLADETALELACSLAKVGASIGTIEAKLRLRPGHLARWLAKGATAPEDTAPRRLYDEIRASAADARALAEATLLQKTPDRWLDRNSLTQLVERSAEHAPSGDLPPPVDTKRMDVAQRLAHLLPAATTVLERQGYADPTARPTNGEETDKQRG